MAIDPLWFDVKLFLRVGCIETISRKENGFEKEFRQAVAVIYFDNFRHGRLAVYR